MSFHPSTVRIRQSSGQQSIPPLDPSEPLPKFPPFASTCVQEEVGFTNTFPKYGCYPVNVLPRVEFHQALGPKQALHSHHPRPLTKYMTDFFWPAHASTGPNSIVTPSSKHGFSLVSPLLKKTHHGDSGYSPPLPSPPTWSPGTSTSLPPPSLTRRVARLENRLPDE